MASININALKTGYIWGDHDVGYIAWVIRWKSAGWSNRDNMAVWSHVGFFDLYSDPFNPTVVHMLDILKRDSVNVRLNKSNDNPGFTSMLRPYVARYYTWGGLYFYMAFYLALQNPSRYDYGQLFRQFFGTTNTFGASSEMICTEFVWNTIVNVERIAGYRMTYNRSDFWPVNFNYGTPMRMSGLYPQTSGARASRPSVWYFPIDDCTRCVINHDLPTYALTPYQWQSRYNIYGGSIAPRAWFVNP